MSASTNGHEGVSSFTSGEPFTATVVDCNTRWGCGKPGENFRCCLCGHKFIPGDTVRWQFTNDTPDAGGNPFVCQPCDGGRDAIIAEIKRRREILKTDQWWWFIR